MDKSRQKLCLRYLCGSSLINFFSAWKIQIISRLSCTIALNQGYNSHQFFLKCWHINFSVALSFVFITNQSPYKSEAKAMKNHLKCLTQYTRKCKDFSKKIVVKNVAYINNCWKNCCSCEKKLWFVQKITAFFVVLCVVCTCQEVWPVWYGCVH